MDDRLIKEPRGYWAFAPSILPQKSHGNAPESGLEMDMANEELVKKVKELLKTDADLGFLLVLKRKDLEKLVACIRGRVDQVGGEKGNRRTRE